MLRFLMHLFDKDYEPCKGCEISKLQIERLESQNNQLLSRLLKLSEPELIPQAHIPVPQKPRIANWNAAKKELEAQDRMEAETRRKIEIEEKELELASKSTGTDTK